MEKVSLYIPTFTSVKYLDKTIPAILEQTYPLEEILIIDDSPDEKIKETFTQSIIRYIRGPLKGLAAARNVAYQEARSEFVAGLDADVVPEKDWLEKLMRNFTDKNTAGTAGMMIEKYTDNIFDRWRATHKAQNWGKNRIINPPYFFGCNHIYRKSIVEKIGYFDDRFPYDGEDVNLCERLKSAGYNIIYDPEALCYHLLHDNFRSLLRQWERWAEVDIIRWTMQDLRGFSKIFKAGFLRFKGLVKFFVLDLKNLNLSLLPLDLLILPIMCYYYIRISRKRRREKAKSKS